MTYTSGQFQQVDNWYLYNAILSNVPIEGGATAGNQEIQIANEETQIANQETQINTQALELARVTDINNVSVFKKSNDYSVFKDPSDGESWLKKEYDNLKPAQNIYRLLGASTTNATVVSSSARTLKSIYLANATAVKYIFIYDKATTPLETDVPILVILVPVGVSYELTPNLKVSNGIAFRTCLTILGPDSSPIAANQLSISITYNT